MPASQSNPVANVTIFEPWGLGDLAIAMTGARALASQGWRVDVACNPTFAPWAASLSFVTSVTPISIPWTKFTGKYLPWRYNFKSFLDFRRTLLTKQCQTLVEIRGDVRNLVFLNALRAAPVVTLVGERIPYRYDRPKELLTKLGFQDTAFVDVRPAPRGETKSVFFFFGATLANRKIPTAVARDIIFGLTQLGLRVTVALAPEEDVSAWRESTMLLRDRVSYVQGNLGLVAGALEASDLCVSTDTGWLHVAYLRALPTIGVFGFDNYREWAPPGCLVVGPEERLAASNLYRRELLESSPLAKLKPESVIDVVRSQVDRQFQSHYRRTP